MNVHFIIHEAYEGPGAFQTWIKDNGFIATSTKVYLGEPLPLDNTYIDLLIVLGGPQCPETTREECHYFKVDEEIKFIKSCIEKDKAIVGVCLGAQLIGEALNASFEKSPNKEIGYFPIELTSFGVEHPKFSHFNQHEVVGHWHNDMPGLTSKCNIIASSLGCPRQIVEYSNLIYGFQCHLEFTSKSLNKLIEVCSEVFDDIDNQSYVQKPKSIIESSSLQMNSLLYEFMDKLTLEYTSITTKLK